MIKPSCQAKSRRTETAFHLYNRLKFAHFIRIYIRNTPVLALKISKRGWACIFGGRVMVII